MRRQPKPKEQRKGKPITLAEWWRAMAKYEGQFPQKRPPDLVVP